jgi:hypothetical protein
MLQERRVQKIFNVQKHRMDCTALINFFFFQKKKKKSFQVEAMRTRSKPSDTNIHSCGTYTHVITISTQGLTIWLITITTEEHKEHENFSV